MCDAQKKESNMCIRKRLYTETIKFEMKKILNRRYHYSIHSISGVPCVTCFYFKRDEELRILSEDQKTEIKEVYLDYLKKKKYVPQRFQESEIEVFFDSIENYSSLGEQIKNLLNQRYGYNVSTYLGSYSDTNVFGEPLKSYMGWVFFQTDKELLSLSEEKKDHIKKLCIQILKEKNYIPHRIKESRIILYFDSDENVQNNFGGSYFYATK